LAGNILHEGALVLCQHPPGTAQPDQTDTRVTVSGRPVITVTHSYTVTGCALEGTNSPPCKTAVWTQGAERVRASGVPVAIHTGQSLCAPSGGRLDPTLFQTRVTAS
jgi:hypothetical protein